MAPPWLAVLLAIVLTVAGGYTGRAQNDLAEPTAAVVEQVEPTQTSEGEPEVPAELPPTEEPPAVPLEPTAVPIAPEETPAVPTDAIEPQSGEADTDAGIDTAAVAPAPSDDLDDPVPALSFAPDLRPICVLTPGQPDALAHGGSQEFACSHAMQVSVQDLAPDSIAIDWAIQAAVGGGWAVQILPPADAAQPTPQWTAEGRANVSLTHHEAAGGGEEPVPSDPVTEQRSLSFGLRVHRAVCGAVAESVEISVAALASTPDVPDAAVTNLAAAVGPVIVTPALAPIPEPSMTMGGSLDYGEIGATSEGPIKQPAPKEVTITVDGLDQACGTYDLSLISSAFDGSDGTELTASTLELVSINGEDVPESCPLDDGCPIASIPTGADAAPTATYTLGVSLVIPDRARVAVFTSTLTASLDRTDAAST